MYFARLYTSLVLLIRRSTSIARGMWLQICDRALCDRAQEWLGLVDQQAESKGANEKQKHFL